MLPAQGYLLPVDKGCVCGGGGGGINAPFYYLPYSGSTITFPHLPLGAGYLDRANHDE